MKIKPTTEEEHRKESLVCNTLKKGNLKAKEIKKELWERNISFVRSYDRFFTGVFTVLAILWLLPAIAKYSGWGFLSFFTQLSRVNFPMLMIVVGAVFITVVIALEVKVCSVRKKLGGCYDTHESVVIVRGGPYKVIRHPGYLAELIYFSLIPIVLSKWLPFTILAVVYIVVWIGMLAYLVREEDNFNIRKWGNEYRQYMREVPAFNFIKGFRNLRRRSRKE